MTANWCEKEKLYNCHSVFDDTCLQREKFVVQESFRVILLISRFDSQKDSILA